ncbi:MAG: Undecaprenyl-phosphate 4-deoxy-4-formamido-L-arabinose transferase [Planctomycetota bacterium]|jgi:dolichol-phosphate mannosyltransferase
MVAGSLVFIAFGWIRMYRVGRTAVSVVIAAHNEAANLPQLLHEITAALSGRFTFEVIVVDDGSTDDTPRVLAGLRAQLPTLRTIRHASSCGQSPALITGIDHAQSALIATLDGDGQNDPADLPAMIEMLLQPRFGRRVQMIAGHRTHRKDSWWRLFSSRIANAVRRRILADGTPDTGCGIKVFYRRVFLQLPRFNHMHRFLPALVVRAGGEVRSIPVNHRPRLHGRSHYDTLRRLVNGLLDLAGVAWLIHRGAVPRIEMDSEDQHERDVLDQFRYGGADNFHGQVSRTVA